MLVSVADDVADDVLDAGVDVLLDTSGLSVLVELGDVNSEVDVVRLDIVYYDCAVIVSGGVLRAGVDVTLAVTDAWVLVPPGDVEPREVETVVSEFVVRMIDSVVDV